MAPTPPRVPNYLMAGCRYCKSNSCVKAGRQANGRQKLFCKACRRYQQAEYSYPSCVLPNANIAAHVKEGVGIRSMGRLLKIAKSTVLRRIRKIAKAIKPTSAYKPDQVYEMDELHTFIGTKEKPCWLIYAIERSTRAVVDFRLGCRTVKNLKQVVESLALRQPKYIYTDKLTLYDKIMKNLPRCTTLHGTNHIERKNLTLRTHLRRLNRRTLCFSRQRDMLEACLKIYFWA